MLHPLKVHATNFFIRNLIYLYALAQFTFMKAQTYKYDHRPD